MFAFWMHLFDSLNFGNYYGPTMAIMRQVFSSILKYLILWVLSLLIFASITIVWLGDDSNYATINLAISSLLFTSLGLQDFPEID